MSGHSIDPDSTQCLDSYEYNALTELRQRGKHYELFSSDLGSMLF